MYHMDTTSFPMLCYSDSVCPSKTLFFFMLGPASSSFSVTPFITCFTGQHSPKTPTRGLSLGERLGSILQGALSLPRQSTYAPLTGDDEDDGDSPEGLGSTDGDGPSTQRALPRDASYLPEWLTRTLRKGSVLGRSFTSQKSSGSLSRGSGVSRAGSTLPEWVDAATLQPSGQFDSDSDETSERGRKSNETRHVQYQQEAARPELFTKALKPIPKVAPAAEPLAPLITAPSWPPTDHEASAAPSKELRGKRLLAFWQQQQAASEAASAMSDRSPSKPHPAGAAAVGQKPGVSQIPASGVHARSRALLSPASQLDTREQAGQETPAGRKGTLLRQLTSAANVTAELEATSQLVHNQTLHQAELLQVSNTCCIQA